MEKNLERNANTESSCDIINHFERKEKLDQILGSANTEDAVKQKIKSSKSEEVRSCHLVRPMTCQATTIYTTCSIKSRETKEEDRPSTSTHNPSVTFTPLRVLKLLNLMAACVLDAAMAAQAFTCVSSATTKPHASKHTYTHSNTRNASGSKRAANFWRTMHSYSVESERRAVQIVVSMKQDVRHFTRATSNVPQDAKMQKNVS